jgi:hypothetical protein
MDYLPELENLFIAGLIYGLLILALHNIKWDLIFGKPLPRVACYTIGLGGLIAGVHLWMHDKWLTFGILIIAVFGGVADLLAYGMDALGKTLSKSRKLQWKQDGNPRKQRTRNTKM